MTQSAAQSKTTVSQFLTQIREFILDEALTQRRQVEQIWHGSLATRVSNGHAIEGVNITGYDLGGTIDLLATRNASRFRPGDILLLNRGNPFEQPRFLVALERDEELTLTVSSQGGINWGEIERQRSGWVLDQGYMDLSSFLLEAINQAGDTLSGRERLLPILMGTREPQIDPQLYDRGLNIGETLGLNWSQSEALANAYATDLAYLIQGPPGTGKTYVLASLVRALVNDGERVLVTALTHRAINNALNKIGVLDPDLPAVKIGNELRAGDLKTISNYEAFQRSPLHDLASGYAIGATPFATQTSRLSGVEFDTVIFDEASQITLPLAVMGMLPAQKYIFLGDQYQLPPVLATNFSGGLLRQSIFGLLVDRGFDTMLTETYRLPPEMVAWPNRHFYGGALTSVVPVENRAVQFPTTPAQHQELLAADNPLVFWDLQHRNTTTTSHVEADAVVELLKTMLDSGYPADEIGVVVPYRAQARLIRNRLRYITDATARKSLIVDTVERMQGQERNVIIVSLTTSHPGFATLLADFFFQPQRVNVAITRPRQKLIIVGSRYVLDAEPVHAEQRAAVALLADLLARCKTIVTPR